jgi:LysM domain
VLSALALATVLYTVKPGDTLSGVAQQYNTTWEAVYDANQSSIRNPNFLYVGEQLLVPEGEQTTGSVPVQGATPQQSASGSNTVQSAPVQSAPVPGTSGQSYSVTPAAASIPAQGTPAQTTPGAASSGASGADSSALDDVPGVPQSFAACVASRESTDDTDPAADGNAYGIVPGSGYSVSGDSLAQQKQVFEEIYATSGPSAWAGDGCGS